MNASNSSFGSSGDSPKKHSFSVWCFILIPVGTLVLCLIFLFVGKSSRKKSRPIQRNRVVIKKSRQSRSSSLEPQLGRATDHVGTLTDMLGSDRKLQPKITDGSSTTYGLSTNSIAHNSSNERNEINDLSDFDLMHIPLRRLQVLNKDAVDSMLASVSQKSLENPQITPFKTTAILKKQPFNMQVSIGSKKSDESFS